MMYASGAWTLTKQMLTSLKRTQRKMLRLVVSTPRRQLNTTTSDSDPSTDDVASNNSNRTDLEQLIHLSDDDLLEPWPEYIKRTTHIAETHLNNANIREWTALYFRKQWRWAQRIANQSHDRWSYLAAHWQPEFDIERPTFRRQARPRKRWDDDIQSFLRTHHPNTTPPIWLNVARDTATWETLENHYIHYMINEDPKHHHHDQQQPQQQHRQQRHDNFLSA